MIPFTPTTPVLLQPEAFPEGPLRTRAGKLPMWTVRECGDGVHAWCNR